MSASLLATWTRSSVRVAWKSAPAPSPLSKKGRLMAHITRRQWNGKVRYLARYTDPAGRERAKSFTRAKDAERFLTGIEDDKLRGTWTDPTLGRVQLADWYALWRRATVELHPGPLRPPVSGRRSGAPGPSGRPACPHPDTPARAP
jgi:hypothetical protein